MAEGLVGMIMTMSWEMKSAKTEYRAADPSRLITDEKYCFEEVARLRGVRLLSKYSTPLDPIREERPRG
jgi:hypothetical protein